MMGTSAHEEVLAATLQRTLVPALNQLLPPWHLAEAAPLLRWQLDDLEAHNPDEAHVMRAQLDIWAAIDGLNQAWTDGPAR